MDFSFSAMSKNALKLKKKREARKAKKELTNDVPIVTKSQNHTTYPPVVSASNGFGDVGVIDDPEKQKKIKKVRTVSKFFYLYFIKYLYITPFIKKHSLLPLFKLKENFKKIFHILNCKLKN